MNPQYIRGTLQATRICSSEVDEGNNGPAIRGTIRALGFRVLIGFYKFFRSVGFRGLGLEVSGGFLLLGFAFGVGGSLSQGSV